MTQQHFKILSRALEAELEPMTVFQAAKKHSNADYRVLLESSEQGTNGSQYSMLLLTQALKIEARGFDVTISSLNDNGEVAVELIQKSLRQSIDSCIEFCVDNNTIKLSYPDNRLIEEESLRVKRATPLDAIRQVLAILSAHNPEDADKLLVAGVVGYDFVDS